MARGKHPIGYWNKERCAKAALKFHTKTQFAKGENGAYTFALKNGFLDEICAHMETRWVKKWASKEACHREALKFNSRSAFAKGCDGAYTYAMRHGFLDEICSHMTPLWEKKWNSKAKCQSEALKYKRRIDFQRGCDGAYTYAMRHGFLDEICQHMETYFDVDSAEKDKKRAAFVKNKLQISSEEWNKIEYLLCNPEGYATQSNRARNKRLIYACEFEDHHVYVGLARNLRIRIAQHLGSCKEKSAIYLHLQKNPSLHPNFKVVRPFEDEEIAKVEEGIVEQEYAKDGWIILNRAKTGSLGGFPLYWNHERCVAVASQCTTRKEFWSKCSGAYASCVKNGWIHEINNIVDTNFRNKWTEDKISESAAKYLSKGDFRKGDPEAHHAAVSFGLIDVLFPFNKEGRKPSPKQTYKASLLGIKDSHAPKKSLKKTPKKQETEKKEMKCRIKWTRETLKQEALKYNTRMEFKANSGGAYTTAGMMGIRDEICAHMYHPTTPQKYTDEDIFIEAKKYSSVKDFKKGSPSIMTVAQNRGILRDVCKHFKPLRKPFNETIEELKKVASTCHSRNEFKIKHSHEYNSAKKMGVFEEVCSSIIKESE